MNQLQITPRFQVLAGGLALLLGTALPVHATIAQGPSVASILAGATASNAASVGRQLVELGPASDPQAFDALVRELGLDSETSTARQVALMSAFEQMGPLRWRAVFASKLDAAPSEATVAAVLVVTGQSGNAQDLPLAIYAAALDHAGARRTELEDCLTQVLVRDGAAFSVLDSAVGTVVPELRSVFVRAVERTKNPAAAKLLASWIEKRPDMRPECLTYLGRLSFALERPFALDVITPVRALVDNGNELVLREAIVCAGRLGDYEVIPALVRILKDGDYGLRSNALWALRYLTGLKLGENPNEWTNWFEAEKNWWAKDSRQAFAALVSGTKQEKVATLRAVASLRAWRDRAANEITIGLDDIDLDVALLTAAELQRLDSPVALPALVDALSGGRAQLAQAAHEALQAITRRELPEDAMACRDLLFPGS